MLPRFVIVLMLLAAGAMPVNAATKSAPSDAMAIVQDLTAHVAAAIDKQDVAGWASVTAPDVTILPASNPLTPGGVIHGRAEAEKLYTAMFQQGMKHATITVLEAHYISRSAIWWVGTIHFSGAREIDARIAQVLVRSKGAWRARLVVLSGDPPRAG